jgi:hypothetical protein
LNTATTISWAQHASNPTNARYVILYKDSGVAATSALIAYADLGSTVDMSTGDLTVELGTSNNGDIATFTAS